MNNNSTETLFLRVVKADSRNCVRLYTATPTPLEEKNLGKLFAIIELGLPGQNNDHIIDLLIAALSDAYYASEQFETEAAFEHALHRMNEQIATIVSEVGSEWLTHCHAVFGVVHGTELVFAHSGSVLGLLTMKDQLIDIIEPDARVSELNPLKFFTNVVAGQLPETGSIFFATDGMMDYLSRETVRRILSEDNSIAALTEFETMLSIDTNDRNFIGILLKRTESKRPAFVTPDSIATDTERAVHSPTLHDTDSMASLMNKEQETAELLTSSVWPTLRKSALEYAQSMMGGKNTIPEKPRTQPAQTLRPSEESAAPMNRVAASNTRLQPQGPAQSPVANIAKQAGVIGASALNLLVQFGKGAWQVIVKLIQRLRGKTPNSSYRTGGASALKNINGAAIRSTATRFFSAVMRWFSKLTLLQKIFVVMAVIVLVIFSQSVLKKSLSNESDSTQDQYAEVLNKIDVKINEGKAAELVNGDSQTKYSEAKSLLATIPKDSKAYKERGAEIEKVLNDELKKSNKVNDLGALSPAIKFSDISSAIAVKQMMLLGASIYAFDANNSSVYRGNLENNEVSVTISDNGAPITAASKASPGTGLVVSNNTVSTFNPVSATVANANLSFATPPQSIVDVTVFSGTRVYTLDAAANQIIRNRKNGDVFQGGENWLTDSSVSVRDGVAMAIDGAVYVLNKNGSVTKLEGGKKADFTLGTVDPALTSGVSIATDENSSNIYIADASQKRVVVFDKKGTLVNQYTSESFENIVDIVADEAGKKLFVLTDNGNVFQIGL